MTPESFPVRVGTQNVELPVVTIGDGTRIALMMTIDMGVEFITTAGRELAELLREFEPQVIATAATLGIPLAIEVSRALGIDDYLVLQKSRKWHLRDSPSVSLTSVTTQNAQSLVLDRRRIEAIRGKRVVFVDDVVSTGGSTLAALGLLEQNGAQIVGIGTVLTEGEAWREALGERAALLRSLGEIPFPVPSPR